MTLSVVHAFLGSEWHGLTFVSIVYLGVDYLAPALDRREIGAKEDRK